MRILRSANYREMPWKNGGGTTTEIAVSPPGATTDGFDWRISMASIQSDGWFSEFPEVDRTLSILHGNGIYLAVSGGAEVRICPASEPFHFPADVPAFARLSEDPIIDLNVMTRRTRFTHRMIRLTSSKAMTWALTADITVFLAYSASLQIEDGTDSARIAPRDSVVFDHEGGSVVASPDGHAEIYVVEFNKV
jgi:environmental stress-induced protein Ves